MNRMRAFGVTVGALALVGTAASAQQSAATVPVPLKAGIVAPDFALPGATRDGPTGHPIRLSDFRDQTVVIAFFYQARTKG